MKKIFVCMALTPSLFYAISSPELDRKLFTEIYNRNLWGSSESRSGDGSTLYRTQEIRRIFPELITRLNIKTILDIGCGDFNWMRTIDFNTIDQYIGIDIVEDAIYDNIIKFHDEKRTFRTANVTRDELPNVDLVLERDCMMHVSNEDFQRYINNLKHSGSKYLLTTTFPNTAENQNFSEAEFYKSTRILRRNLQKAPFNFPDPIALFDEGYEEKAIALWRIEDLPWFGE